MSSKNMIKTIIFDWGGVLTVGKYTQSFINTIAKEKGIHVEEIYKKIDRLIVEMNRGKLSFRDFAKKLNGLCNTDMKENEAAALARKAIIPNNPVITLAGKLKKEYALILMSDNYEVNVRHLARYHKEMLSLFSRKYFSCMLKMTKPNKNFFKYIISNAKLNPKECIFIDDKKKNVDVAEKIGTHGIVFSNLTQLKKELKVMGIKI